MFLPEKIDVHGLWVRSNHTDRFGRISFPSMMDGHEGYWIMWEPKDQGKHGGHTASWAPTEELEVRPYKPKPWFTTEYFHSITDIELFIREMVRDELKRRLGENSIVTRSDDMPEMFTNRRGNW